MNGTHAELYENDNVWRVPLSSLCVGAVRIEKCYFVFDLLPHFVFIFVSKVSTVVVRVWLTRVNMIHADENCTQILFRLF